MLNDCLATMTNWHTMPLLRQRKVLTSQLKHVLKLLAKHIQGAKWMLHDQMAHIYI